MTSSMAAAYKADGDRIKAMEAERNRLRKENLGWKTRFGERVKEYKIQARLISEEAIKISERSSAPIVLEANVAELVDDAVKLKAERDNFRELAKELLQLLQKATMCLMRPEMPNRSRMIPKLKAAIVEAGATLKETE